MKGSSTFPEQSDIVLQSIKLVKALGRCVDFGGQRELIQARPVNSVYFCIMKAQAEMSVFMSELKKLRLSQKAVGHNEKREPLYKGVTVVFLLQSQGRGRKEEVGNIHGNS